MVDVHVGTVNLRIEFGIDTGTPPFEVYVKLFDNDVEKETKRLVIPDLGTYVSDKIFSVEESGKHTLRSEIKIVNPWGEEILNTNTLEIEIIQSVIPIDISEPWVIWYKSKNLGADISSIVNYFRTNGWNIVDRVDIDLEAESRDAWIKFTGDTRNAICLIGYSNARFFWDGPAYFGTLVDGSKKPGTVGSSYEDDRYIYGNGKKYYSEDFALIKYLMYGTRSVIVCFEDGYGSAMYHAWRKVAEMKSAVTKAWFIINKDGKTVDLEM